MTDAHLPESETETAAIVADAFHARRPLAIEGGGTRRGLGRPVAADQVLATRRLTGITLHEPAELVVSARAGTPLAEVEAALAAARQGLPFEPMDHRALYGSSGSPTIGAVAACNLSGPRRVSAGAARDALIGVRFVNGEGAAIKSGGRVMKNVTGLDLVKLQCGAHGTLGVLTEVTFRVLPLPETAATLVVTSLSETDGIALLSRALGSPYAVSGAAHLPPGIGDERSRTLLRVEGPRTSVAHRTEALAALFDGLTWDVLDADATAQVWRGIRDAAFLAEPREATVWRLSVTPGKASEAAKALARFAGRHFFDWGGGLLWLAIDGADATTLAAVQTAAAQAGGHATLVRASPALRQGSVFQPLPDALLALTRRLKASFDPGAILNPGRMYAGV